MNVGGPSDRPALVLYRVGMELDEVMEGIATGFEVAGVAIIVIGGVHTLAQFFSQGFRWESIYNDARRRFGRPLILGLEVLVAADIIQTITVDLSLESVATLGVLVLVRVVLSFALDIEVDGRFPWRRARADQRSVEAS